MKHYLIWLLVSAGVHGGLLWGLPSGLLQPAELPLQSGQEAVSLGLIRMTASSAQAPSESKKEALAPIASPPSSTANNQGNPGPENASDSPPKLDRVVKTANPNKSPKIEPVLAQKITEPSRIKEIKAPQKTAPTKETLNQEVKTTLPASAAPISTATALPEGVVTQATPLSSQKPKYPKPAITRNQQGKVTVQLLIDSSGKAQTVKLIKSSGYALLDKSVIRFVRQEKFVSATRNGIPVDSLQAFSFQFVLK